MKKNKKYVILIMLFCILILGSKEVLAIKNSLPTKTENRYPHGGDEGCYWTGKTHVLTAETNTKLYMDRTSGKYTKEIKQGDTITYLGDWTKDRMNVKYGNSKGWININSMPSIKGKFIRYVATEYGDLSATSSCDGDANPDMPHSLGRTVWPGDTIYVIKNEKNGVTRDGTVTQYVRIEKTSSVHGEQITQREYEGWTVGSFALGSIVEIEGDTKVINYQFPGKEPVRLTSEEGEVDVEDVYVGGGSSNNGGSNSNGRAEPRPGGEGSGSTAPDDGLGDLGQYGGTGDSVKLREKAGVILGAIQAIGAVVSVIMLIVIGIKYMLGSVEEKAEYKKTLMPYLIGAFLVFTGTLVPQIIYSLLQGMN